MASSDAGARQGRDPRLLLLNPTDNVVVARQPVAAGEVMLLDGGSVRLAVPLRLGHKLARRAIAEGEPVIKYGFPIGFASSAITPGEHVHLHNVRSGYTASVALAGADTALGLAGSDGPGPYEAGERDG